MPNVVGIIDGTSHEILISSTESHQDFIMATENATVSYSGMLAI